MILQDAKWCELMQNEMIQNEINWHVLTWLTNVPNFLDSKMIGIEKCETTMINEVNTMTPRQNDLVVKNLL